MRSERMRRRLFKLSIDTICANSPAANVASTPEFSGLDRRDAQGERSPLGPSVNNCSLPAPQKTEKP